MYVQAPSADGMGLPTARADSSAAIWACCGSLYDVPAGLGSASGLGAGTLLPLAGQSVEQRAALRDGTWRDLIGWFSDWDVETMARIVECESGGRNVASEPDSDGLRSYGPFQIHGEPEVLDNVAYGAERAHEKYVGAVAAGGTGYEPWRGSRGCWG